MHDEIPRPTVDDPAAFFKANSAGVDLNASELDVHRGNAAAIRNAVSQSTRASAAQRPAGFGSRGLPDFRFSDRLLCHSRHPTTTNPAIVSIAGHMKLSARIEANDAGRRPLRNVQRTSRNAAKARKPPPIHLSVVVCAGCRCIASRPKPAKTAT